MLRLTPLGGVGRFGRNCLVIEDEATGSAVVVDCGVRFAGPELPGFDVGLPDLERLGALGDRLLAYIVTHGHEDHIGAMPLALREQSAPIYCTSFTARFLQRRCARIGEKRPPIDVLSYGEMRTVGPFSFSFAAVSHSIPGAASLILRTPAGVVVHSGDFRVDEDPVFGLPTDLESLSAAAGPEGVACLLADSTGATIPGRNGGEKAVGPPLDRCFSDGDDEVRGAIFVSLFASHLQRLALLIDICRRRRRKLVLLGRGMLEALQMGLAEGVIDGSDVIVGDSALRNLPRSRLCIALTGSQGEERAALARLSRRDPTLGILVEPGDRVVFSARVIPGNERSVQPIVDAFIDQGADVVAGRAAPHVSGHGYAEDLRLLLKACRPRVFVALHGNPENLVAHGDLAREVGLDDERIVGLRDGHTLVLDRSGGPRHLEGARAHEPAGIDGDVCWFPASLVHSRQRMGKAGVLIVSVAGDDVSVTPHAVFPDVDGPLMGKIKESLGAALRDRGSIDDAARRSISRIFYRQQRSPPELLLMPTTIPSAPA
ncbi:MAG: ribonuclease J [Deltaproteobacteria bacterium]|nr:ribonuclease J [Deltaproteobacteria bacterium]